MLIDQLSIDLDTLVLTISLPATQITTPSAINVNVTGQVLGLSYLPTKSAMFKLILVSDYIPAAKKTQPLNTTEPILNKTLTKNTTVYAFN